MTGVADTTVVPKTLTLMAAIGYDVAMDDVYYNRLRSAIQRTYDTAVAQAQATRQRQLEMLNELRSIDDSDTDATPLTNGHVRKFTKTPVKIKIVKRKSSPKGEVDALVRTAVPKFESKFTWMRLQKSISESTGRLVKRSSLMQALRRLKDEGLVKVVVQGAGRKPSWFKATVAEIPEK